VREVAGRAEDDEGRRGGSALTLGRCHALSR
jgi:hypothetical protein